MKKTVVMLLSVTALILFAPLYAYANSEISVSIVINENPIELELEQPPVIIDGRILVPVRGVFEAKGFEVNWDSRVRTVFLSYVGNEVIIVIGRYHFRLNGSLRHLDVPAQIINGRTMLPLRALSEVFGATVEWDAEQRLVSVVYPHAVPWYIPLGSLRGYTPYEPFAFFVVSANGEIEQKRITTPFWIGTIFATWLNLNGISDDIFIGDIFIADIRKGEGVMVIGAPRIDGPTLTDNYLVLYLSHSNEFEARLNGEHGAALLESLERTLRGLYYFGDLMVNFR